MIDIPALVAIIGGLAAALTGIGAYLRSGADRDNVIVESAETVVAMLTTQLSALDGRLSAVEGTVLSWESWAERVLQLLDRTISMLDAEHKAEVARLASVIRDERPMRSYPGSHLVDTPQPKAKTVKRSD